MFLAEGLLELTKTKLDDVQTLLVGGMLVVGIIMVIATYVKTKAMVPTLGAILLAAIASFAAFSPTWLRDRVSDEANQTNNIAPAQQAR